ncbi:MAG TPA: alpha/beta fold hydrolase [Flavobacteriaceae bacterium]|nr:alpha/beta fold hydrolase [Flavobacteriaceae bacterium]MCB9213415.1 alpha/beta fold hydrolase [Alteromonas sp.]HPF10309.1 alpha/beta fold hydrolase [Flavobacteriaceae bacterium]HQU20755.1 alpha/beta fold hydrolase [Flavobacteriaceae bacterium]HQU64827.1 alpha/beta fold hydrolase [Flavobacteriaceae bacterium]
MMKQQLSLSHEYRPSSLPKNAPLILMLHGYGSDRHDLFSFASELPTEYAIVSLEAPYTLKPFGHAWYAIHFDAPQGKWSDNDQAMQSRELVVRVLDEILERYPVDPKQVTLLGFSQGTIVSFAVALSYPEKIANVIGLSGYINEEILKVGYEKNNFSNLHVYTSHGSVDQVIPVQWARETQPFLQHLSIDCTYSEFPMGHGVSPQNFYEFKNWLLKRTL